jgi:hypothetical protein
MQCRQVGFLRRTAATVTANSAVFASAAIDQA